MDNTRTAQYLSFLIHFPDPQNSQKTGQKLKVLTERKGGWWSGINNDTAKVLMEMTNNLPKQMNREGVYWRLGIHFL